MSDSTTLQYGLRYDDIAVMQSVFKEYPQIEKAILYGSRAMGTYRNSSDIDLTLIGSSLSLTVLQKVEADLDDLMLPYKIDLSIYSKIQNPDLLAHINRVGKVFYQGLKG